ncbi:hypothetical protein T265_00599 [Opisthorchis viverrini]|uniref:Ubiquitin carboxyl-terminal hydrolase n=1 Tax=Opisthorchis viverrini TaxID=6198 RepID=A0A075A179_OPIVI|nr:hypothetical protein T265_00599 [Opisthorchis viverrini]KER33483.1 hypothetical protein T265_00599 [Opisthorchis viverrini]
MRWLPLEANPDVLNKYLHKLGVENKWQFRDVYGLDEEALKTVPTPVEAVMLLFPLSNAEKTHQLGKEVTDDKVYLIHQTAVNACGTVAILHALCNNSKVMDAASGSVLGDFVKKTSGMTPDQRGIAMEEDKNLFNIHETLAMEGQTQTPCRESDTQKHFVTFVVKDGSLYELDGRRSHPILHGNSTPHTLLNDASVVIKKFMERDNSTVNFSVLALISA